ncbi:hypothetical protein B4U80_07216 [Leptotrombidium deliense]|uniref:Uncharacterized protein n=1 Tax=Leptotrombidium deliense TaxID=299467 RepID=A0A443ST86_9ACAR|nr:hypothetical protein B4U80_07216 [Leptotrombidium deliense]
MNHTQQLCDCSRNYDWECSSEPTAEDGHTIELTRRYDKMVYTQIKLCEPMMTVRTCKTPTDWTLLAMQSERTGPYTHNHPPYARIPGIRVYGMLCSQGNRLSKQKQETDDETTEYPEFPWDHAYAILNSTALPQLFSL